VVKRFRYAAGQVARKIQHRPGEVVPDAVTAGAAAGPARTGLTAVSAGIAAAASRAGGPDSVRRGRRLADAGARRAIPPCPA